MPTQKQLIIIFGILGVVAFGLGYWDGMPEKDSGQRAEVVAPTIVTNVVTNTLREVVTNIVAVAPQPTPTPTPPNIVTANAMNPIIEKAIRKSINKPTGELTKADFEKVTKLNLDGNKLTEIPNGLEKLTQLKSLFLNGNQLTDVKGLEKLTQLEWLYLGNNQLTSVKGLEKLTNLEKLNVFNNNLIDANGLEKLTQLQQVNLGINQLTDVTGLENLTQLEWLYLQANPALTKAQIDQLQKALPNCRIDSNPKK